MVATALQPNLPNTSSTSTAAGSADTAKTSTLETLGTQPTASEQQRISDLQQQFQQRARQDPAGFRSAMRAAFGDKASLAEIDQLLDLALAGKLPIPSTIQFVEAGSLGSGALGAYDASNGGSLYLDRSLLSDPSMLQSVFNEEMGHHLDALLGGTDAAGDEGAVFSRTLEQGTLSQSELTALKSENDHGFIDMDGKQVSVEFRNEDEGSGNGQGGSDTGEECSADSDNTSSGTDESQSTDDSGSDTNSDNTSGECGIDGNTDSPQDADGPEETNTPYESDNRDDDTSQAGNGPPAEDVAQTQDKALGADPDKSDELDEAPVENGEVAAGAAIATPAAIATRPGFWAGARAAVGAVAATMTAGVGAIVAGVAAIVYPSTVGEGSDVVPDEEVVPEEDVVPDEEITSPLDEPIPSTENPGLDELLDGTERHPETVETLPNQHLQTPTSKEEFEEGLRDIAGEENVIDHSGNGVRAKLDDGTVVQTYPSRRTDGQPGYTITNPDGTRTHHGSLTD